MIEYTLAHVGINCVNAEEAHKGAVLFEAMFGLTAKEGNSSVFAGKAVELMKASLSGQERAHRHRYARCGRRRG